jgi:hypothetical protein
MLATFQERSKQIKNKKPVYVKNMGVEFES